MAEPCTHSHSPSVIDQARIGHKYEEIDAQHGHVGQQVHEDLPVHRLQQAPPPSEQNGWSKAGKASELGGGADLVHVVDSHLEQGPSASVPTLGGY